MKLEILILTSLVWSFANASTIPCPGYTDPSNFTSVPLSERPNLSKIVQNGYQPNLLTAVLPTTGDSTVLPSTHPHEGFVNRPFRTLSEDACRWSTSGPYIRCINSGSFSFGPASGSLPERQALLQMGLGYADLPRVEPVLNPSYSLWADRVMDFFAEHNQGDHCLGYSSTMRVSTEYSCSVVDTDCQVLEPEFISDLHALPTTVGEIVQEEYQAFVDKWGHGTINGFKLGMVDVQVSPRDVPDPTPSLHMGRAGGTGNVDEGEDIYTDDECLDPAPVLLNYQPWSKILDQLFWYEQLVNGTNSLPDIDALVMNFQNLEWSYALFSQQAREFDDRLMSLNCPKHAPSNAPTIESDSTEAPLPASTPAPSSPGTSGAISTNDISSSSLLLLSLLGTIEVILG